MAKANIVNRGKEELSLENVLILAIKTPGVKIQRDTLALLEEQ